MTLGSLPQPIVLIIDDNPTNLSVMANYLEEYGFEAILARDGEDGIETAQHMRPDLILLDVMMPGIDGFETCRRLKTIPEIQEIPVIFMTALSETEDKVRGFEAGAVDYVTKPLQPAEVLARVTTHLRLRELTNRLAQANTQLVKLNADKDKFFSIVAHDLRGPFMPLMTSSQLLSEMITSFPPEQIQRMAKAIHDSSILVFELLENLLEWSRMQLGHMTYQPEKHDLGKIIQRNIQLASEYARNKDISLQSQAPSIPSSMPTNICLIPSCAI